MCFIELKNGLQRYVILLKKDVKKTQTLCSGFLYKQDC